MSYQSNRLKFGLLMALGASRTLRAQWLKGCGWVIGGCLIGFVILAPFETSSRVAASNIVQLLMYGLWLGLFAGIGGLGTWFVACLIGATGKQLKNDYRRDKLWD